MRTIDDQLRDLARLADESLPWIDPVDVMAADRVAVLAHPESDRTVTVRRSWPIAVVAAAVVIAVLAIPILFLPGADSDPASDDPSTSTTLGTTLTTLTPTSVGRVLPPEAGSVGWSWVPVENFPGGSSPSWDRPRWLQSGAWLQIVDGLCPKGDETPCRIAVSNDLSTWEVSDLPTWETSSGDFPEGRIWVTTINNGVVAMFPEADLAPISITRDGEAWDVRSTGDDTPWALYGRDVHYLQDAVIASESSPVLPDPEEAADVAERLATIEGRLLASAGPDHPFEVVLEHPSTGIILAYVLGDMAYALLSDDGEQQIWTSDDGRNWDRGVFTLDGETTSTTQWRKIIQIGTEAIGFGVVKGPNGEALFIARTSNGTDWEILDPRLSDGTRLTDAVPMRTARVENHIGTLVMSVLRGEFSERDYVLVSTDGVTWYPTRRPPGAGAQYGPFAYPNVGEFDIGQLPVSPTFWMLLPPP